MDHEEVLVEEKQEPVPTEETRPVEGQKASRARRKPSLVINVYSWATPVLSILMLVAGLLLGYFGRPLIDQQPATQTGSPSAPQTTGSNPQGDQDLMEFLVGQTRHFKGDPNAPVTLIEFSDYQ